MPEAKRSLSNVEYLCLKMQANPGMPGRWYRRALGAYHGFRSGTSDNFNMYFMPRRTWGENRNRQVGRYWVDTAERTRKAGGMGTATHRLVPARSEWTLTGEGWAKANVARRKLGLPEVPVPPELLVN